MVAVIATQAAVAATPSQISFFLIIRFLRFLPVRFGGRPDIPGSAIP
jgi:hypothetical protein